jgi:hypothetical protein
MATLFYKGLTGIRDDVTVDLATATLDDLIAAIASDEGLPTDYYTISVYENPAVNSIALGDSTTTCADAGIVDGDLIICTPEQIGSKERRQKQKLDIAAVARSADSNPRSTYDITLLPTQYNNNAVINNPNVGGLVVGRPWIETVSTFTFYEAFGTTSAISTTQYVSGNKIYAEASTYDVPDFQPARVVVNDIEVLLAGEDPGRRGHNMVVLDTYGDVVTPATQYDTYIDPNNLTALASALNSVASGNIVVLVTYDASALDAGVRSALNTGYGSTNSDTWTAQRKSHIFIGEKI